MSSMVPKKIKAVLNEFIKHKITDPIEATLTRTIETLVKQAKDEMENQLVTCAYPTTQTERNVSGREQWIQEKLGTLPTGIRLLDAGAGELSKKKYCEHLRYVSQDFGKYDGKGDGSSLQTGTWDQTQLDIVSDITDIPEPDQSFDAILCVEVFEHLPNPLSALKEFSRLLKPGGDLILTAPFASFVHFSPYYFHTGFSKYWYETHLKDMGFQLVEVTPNGNYTSYMIQEIDRISQVAKEHCDTRLDKWEEKSLNLVKSLLERMHTKDLTSHKLACFGFHVHAKKK